MPDERKDQQAAVEVAEHERQLAEWRARDEARDAERKQEVEEVSKRLADLADDPSSANDRWLRFIVAQEGHPRNSEAAKSVQAELQHLRERLDDFVTAGARLSSILRDMVESGPIHVRNDEDVKIKLASWRRVVTGGKL